MRYLLIFLCCCIPSTLFSQSFFYNTLQFGLKSTLLGGAVTAGNKDLSMVYYNPAGLRYIKNKGIDLAIIVPSVSIYDFGEYFEEGVSTNDYDFSLNSSLITYKTTLKKNIDLVFTLLPKDNWESALEYNNKSTVGNLQTEKSFSYEYTGRERWYGIGCHWKRSAILSLGFSQFWTLQKSNYRYSLSAKTFDTTTDQLQAFFSENVNLQYASSMAMVSKFGLALDYNKMRIGIVLTSPSYLPIFKKASFEKSSTTLEDQQFKVQNFVDYNLSPTLKTAWDLKLGLVWLFNKHNELWLNIAYHTAVPEYDMFSVQSIDNQRLTFQNSYESVSNISFGFVKSLNRKMQFLTSIRSNFLAYENKANSPETQSLYLLDTDQTHLVAGIKRGGKKGAFALGVDWGFAFKTNNELFQHFPNIDLFETSPSRYSHNTFTLLVSYKFLLETVKNIR